MWQEDIKNHVESVLKQDRVYSRQEAKKDLEKTFDKVKSEISNLKEQIVMQQDVNRDTAMKIDKVSSSQDILLNYNDLPDQINKI